MERGCGTALSEIMVPKPESGLDLDEMRSGDPSVPSLVRGGEERSSGRQETELATLLLSVGGTVVRGESAIQAVRSCPVVWCVRCVRACEWFVWARCEIGLVWE